MTYVITQACVGVKDRGCIPACPVECIAEGEKMLYVNPATCIDCDACRHVCPVQAIFPADELPEALRRFVEINARFFEVGEAAAWPNESTAA